MSHPVFDALNRAQEVKADLSINTRSDILMDYGLEDESWLAFRVFAIAAVDEAFKRAICRGDLFNRLNQALNEIETSYKVAIANNNSPLKSAIEIAEGRF